MSDIRDRIAAVLLGPAGLDGSGYPPGTLGHYRRLDEAHRLADVLIQELGMRQMVMDTKGDNPMRLHCYTTRWERIT